MPAPLIIAAVATAAAAGAQAYSASQQAKAAAQAADYNAKVDVANAQQQAINAQANISKQRQDNAQYLSQQNVAYAASGILSDTGSPMALQATTAGRMEQNIQQYWGDTQTRESTEYAAAEEGVLQGQETASAFHLQAASDILKGVGSVASMAGSAGGGG